MNTPIKQLTAATAKLFGALVGRPSSSDEAAVDQLRSTARAAFQTAHEASQAARARFDDTGAAADLELCLAAEEAERAAQLHVERAERIAARAADERAAAHRAELVRRCDELQAGLERARSRAEQEPLEAEHAAALVRAAELFAERRQQKLAVNASAIALHRLQEEIREFDQREQARREGREPEEFERKADPYLFSDPDLGRAIAALHQLLDGTDMTDQAAREHVWTLINALNGKMHRRVIGVPLPAAAAE